MVTSSTRLMDSINMAFIIYTTYHIGITNFGDYRSILFVPWYATAKKYCSGLNSYRAWLIGVFPYVHRDVDLILRLTTLSFSRQ